MSENLLCKDCKHSFVTWSDRLFKIFYGRNPLGKYSYKCKKFFEPDGEEFDPVIGTVKTKGEYLSCVSLRATPITVKDYNAHCGPEGRHWVPKHKKDLFKLLTKE